MSKNNYRNKSVQRSIGRDKDKQDYTASSLQRRPGPGENFMQSRTNKWNAGSQNARLGMGYGQKGTQGKKQPQSPHREPSLQRKENGETSCARDYVEQVGSQRNCRVESPNLYR